MKVSLMEHEGCFGFNFEPETIAEAALLVRFGINATKEIRGVDTSAYRDGTFNTFLTIGKRKNTTGAVRK